MPVLVARSPRWELPQGVSLRLVHSYTKPPYRDEYPYLMIQPPTFTIHRLTGQVHEVLGGQGWRILEEGGAFQEDEIFVCSFEVLETIAAWIMASTNEQTNWLQEAADHSGYLIIRPISTKESTDA